ncbi:hypothetical protein E6C67_08145 [Azospirillum sp. TSA2s]|uniref:hypothetical protein n=1 Tax=Azospirillum sp. TSA2s TaxID=709810 RepID=UPI0010AAB78D|nr:hypothetical protein [Azospirillum sp. TSA2s]QCG93911.1 hypothetical protein E6C67_08145 [Azospirillum sp. TSA2s]
MATFITLTSRTSGTKLRINADHLTSYFVGAVSGTDLVFEGGHDFAVTETPEQIDALLGVTESAAVAMPKMVAALEMAREYLSDWTGGKPCLDAIDAALRAARGE